MYSAIEHWVNITLHKCCIVLLVERGLPFLPRDCQGWLPVAWETCDIETSWVGRGGGGVVEKTIGGQKDSKYKIMPSNTPSSGIQCVCLNTRSIINKKTELNIIVDDIKPHIIGNTESWANNDIQMPNWASVVMSCLGKTEWKEEDVECYYTSMYLYQHMKYSYQRKHIAMRPYGAD